MMLALIAAASVAAAPVDHPKTYLASLRIPLRQGRSVESFSIRTWGVRFKAVCHIPYGWRIKAGNGASPDGDLEGEGSQGITWLNRRAVAAGELKNLVLLTLLGP